MRHALALALTAVLSPAANAVVLVSNIAEPIRATTAVDSELWAAQSFVNDGQTWSLTSIRTVLGGESTSPNAVIELREGTVSGALLSTFAPPTLSGPQSITTITPASAVSLSPGQTYWLIFGVAGQGGFGWSYAEGNGQTGTGSLGAYAYSFDQGANWGSFGTDNPYLIEVNVAVIPEPATWLMLIGGFAAAGMVTRRRTKALA